MVRVLVFSTLYPNASQPNHGIFVENRLRHTLALGGLEARVLAPVPYFPSSHPAFGRYAVYARVPRHEVRHGIDLWHPRYLAVPRVGALLTPRLLFHAALRAIRRMQAEGEHFDLIDAHYFYPDGVAAAWLGRALELPVMITGRGTDLTLIPRSATARAMIRSAAEEASTLITVCEDLKSHLVALGVPDERVVVLRNGVDLKQFTPEGRARAREMLGVKRFALASVGSLIPRKGHHLVIEALAHAKDCELLIAGGGPMRGELESLAARLGVADRVRFLGEVPHDQLADVYRAADALVLASAREGWANVLLEAMACGTPAIATDVNGTAEVVQSAVAGRLMEDRTPGALLAALAALRAGMPDRAQTRLYAETFSWTRIAHANRALMFAAAAHGYRDRHARHLREDARRILLQGDMP